MFKDIKYDIPMCHEGHEDITAYLHFSAFFCIFLHFSAFQYISLNFSEFLCISLHFSEFFRIFLHFSASYILYFRTILLLLLSLENNTCRESQVYGVDAHGDRKIRQYWNKNIRCRSVGGNVCDRH